MLSRPALPNASTLMLRKFFGRKADRSHNSEVNLRDDNSQIAQADLHIETKICRRYHCIFWVQRILKGFTFHFSGS